MKRKILSILLVLCLTFLGLCALTACGEQEVPQTPQKLSAPVVTLNGSVASWAADENAEKFEISLDGVLSYVENTITSKTLTDGQTLKVRAVGDGSAYTTSDWSNSVTFVAIGESDTETETETEVESETDSNVESETDSEVESETDSEVESEIDSEVESETDTETEVGSDTETEVDTNTDTETESDTNTSTETESDTNTDTETDSDTNTSTETESDTNTDTETDSDSGKPEPTPQPTKLGTPSVSVSKTGLASWEAVANASGYIYKIDGGKEINTTQTSIQLSNGQSIVVKAVGNGESYTDSDYSASVTYTQGTTPTPKPENEPEYLGIFASSSAPSQADGLPGSLASGIMPMSSRLMALRSSRSFNDALAEYFEDSNNHLSANYPEESSYDLYSRAGETVYVQIWLNNPAQYTILSLKLNGTKYQVGGGLSSFFIEDGGEYYNCVYVAVTIPEGTYFEKDYTVTDIEYIADTYINADGTDEFMNNNDTVSIGLPYNAPTPIVSDFTPTSLTYNSASATFNLSSNDLATLCGGWIGVSVYDGNNIIANKAISVGENEISVEGLVENTYYSVIVYLFGDLHDGNGVSMHYLYSYDFMTESVIGNFSAEPEFYANWGFEGIEEADSGLAIHVDFWLDSYTATIDRLELYKGDSLVYTDEAFSGYKTIKELLADTEYLVKVYYSDNEYSEHYAESYVTTGTLEKPEMNMREEYSFLTAAAITFDGIENGWNGIAIAKNIEIKLFKNFEEARVSSFILQLCDNPNALDEAWERYNEAEANEQWGLASKIWHEEISFLEQALNLIEGGDYSSYGYDKTAWEELFNSTSTTYTLGSDDFFTNNDTSTTYLIARDFFEMFGESCAYEISANVDFKDGNGFVRTVLSDGEIRNMQPINSSDNYLEFDFSVDGYTVTVNPHCKINYEDKEVAIVSYSIGIYKNWELVETLYTSKELDWGELDEEAWINAYACAMKGEAILPSEPEIIDELGWRAIFEIVNGLDIEAEDDTTGGSNGDIVIDGNGAIDGNGSVASGKGEKNIANLAERELLRALMAYDYPSSYEYRLKTQMLETFEGDENFREIIGDATEVDEMLELLIDQAYNSTIISVLSTCELGIYHYLSWFGTEDDEIYIGFKSCIENYMEENSITSSVNWEESYRRIMMFEDFYSFYPFGEFDTVELTIDADKYDAGEYQIGVEFRFDDYEEDYYETRYADDKILISGVLPTPSINIIEGRYIGEPTLEINNFWEYYFEIELLNADYDTIYTGSYNDFDMWANPLAVGYKVRVRAVINDGVTTYYENSSWSEWYLYEGVKVATPGFNDYSLENCTISWNVYDDNVASYVYTINGGAEFPVAKDTEFSVALSDGDVLRVKSVAVTGGEYVDSDWAEYVCNDKRVALSTPTNLQIDDSGVLTWSAVEGASYYLVEYTMKGRLYTTTAYNTETYAEPGQTYRVRAMTEDLENYKPGAWSEAITFSLKLDTPTFNRTNSTRVYWMSVSYASGYNYKIGEDGSVESTTRTYIDISLVGLGEKLYVQAYADECESSDWGMIYHNVTTLATPNVTVAGGTATWEAIDGAEGYLYKINDGEETATTELSVSGLVTGDTIVVCATTTQLGYVNSEWSEERTQLPIMTAPTINTEEFNTTGNVIWTTVEGATHYIFEIDGYEEAISETSYGYALNYGTSVRVRAACNSGEYEELGPWSELAVREDTRLQLAAPEIAYDPEVGLTVVTNDTNVICYVYKFEGNDEEYTYFHSFTGEAEVITQSFAFPNGSGNVYVKAVPNDSSIYKNSEWATIYISFDF